MRMFVKFRDSKSGSQHFSIIKEQQTVLRMDKGVNKNIFKMFDKLKTKKIFFRFLESTCS